MTLKLSIWMVLNFLYTHASSTLNGFSESTEVDIVIIGAGQAGMAAAHAVRKQGLSVHVIEATEHVGGRTRNLDVEMMKLDVATDDVVELGGTWLSPQHTAALSLARDLGIDVYNASFVRPNSERLNHIGASMPTDWPWWYWGPDYPTDQKRHVQNMVFHSAEGRFKYRNPSELQAGLSAGGSWAQLQRAGEFIDSATANISADCWNATSVTDAWRRFDADSTAGVLYPPLHSAEAKQILRNTIHDHNAQEPEAVSFLYNLMSFKGCNSAGPDEQFRVRGGTQALPLAIANGLGKNVTLNSPVRSVHADEKRVRVITSNGRQIVASVAIITGPPPSVMGIDFFPPLRGPQAQLLQRMPMGTSLKFAAIYKEGPWWRDLGFQGDILATKLPAQLSLPAPDSNIPLFVQCVDHSPFSRRLGVIVCFMEGRQNLYFTSLDPKEQGDLMRQFLKLSFNDSRAVELNPSFYAHNWADQPFARGAYTGFFATGVQSVPEYWDAYRKMEKLPNVLLAGSDYHTGFGNGYIEGAIRDGQRAAAFASARLHHQQAHGSILV